MTLSCVQVLGFFVFRKHYNTHFHYDFNLMIKQRHWWQNTECQRVVYAVYIMLSSMVVLHIMLTYTELQVYMWLLWCLKSSLTGVELVPRVMGYLASSGMCTDWSLPNKSLHAGRGQKHIREFPCHSGRQQNQSHHSHTQSYKRAQTQIRLSYIVIVNRMKWKVIDTDFLFDS